MKKNITEELTVDMNEPELRVLSDDWEYFISTRVNNICHWKFNSFVHYGQDCDYFIETGTHLGDALGYANLIGFEKLLSVELNSTRQAETIERYKKYDHIELYTGMSMRYIDKMLSSVPKDKKALVSLDAHAEGGGAPALQELDVISEYSTTHTILVEDIPIYYDAEAVKSKLLEINPDYNIELWGIIPEFHPVGTIIVPDEIHLSMNGNQHNYTIVAYVE
jgi:hypothetical protein